MFEFIGIAVVGWLVVSIFVRFIGRTKSTSQSQEFGKESRHIATRELGVPAAFYNHSVGSHMDEVKQAAVALQESGDDYFKNLSWPRLLAWGVYSGYRHHCEQSHYGNPISQNLLDDLRISGSDISTELSRESTSLKR
ncbi:hypothetical protein AB6D06_04150 [Vibrio sp. 10N.239.311.G01]|uniref:hypothetical protein n=1 Tax=Vibrio sp. 10N.239.311.G01 TaxID=3229976 RepID=UPI00354BBFA0